MFGGEGHLDGVREWIWRDKILNLDVMGLLTLASVHLSSLSSIHPSRLLPSCPGCLSGF